MITFGTLFTESVKEVEDLNEQIQLLDEMPGANMDTRAVHKHLKKQGWSLTRSSGGHDVFTHPEAKHHIPVPRHRQLKAPLVRGILKQSEVRNEEVEQLVEYGDTAKGQKMLTKVQKRAVDRVVSKKADTDPKYAKKNQDTANAAYERMKMEATGNPGMPTPHDQGKEHAKKGHPYDNPYNQSGEEHEHSQYKKGYESHKKQGVAEESKGLWANIHAKRERIKNGSGERMRKPGSEGAPSAEDLKNSQVKEDTIQEGRPSQRHPLEGHEYHRKTNAELEYIAKDAHKAAEAMKSHNTDAENKYRDQASDSATVRYFRKKNGMQPWYKKKYGHVNEETSKHAGWIAHYNGQKHEIPKEHAKDLYDAKQKAIAHFKAPKSKHGLIAIKPAYNEEVVLEDNVINTNAVNSVHAQPKKKVQDVERYVTGQSKVVSGTNVVASPRESVQEGVAMNIAKSAARRNAGLTENENTLSSYDKEDTPAKKTLSKTAGMVKDLANKAKEKAKGKKSDDTFQPEPELASNIVR